MEALWTFLEAQASNDFLVGGAVLAAVGVGAAALSRLFGVLRSLATRFLSWSVTIENQHQAYGQLLGWLAATDAFARLRRLRFDAFEASPAACEEDEAPSRRRSLTPEAGRFWLWRDGALVAIDRRIDDKPIPGRMQRCESVTLTFIGLSRARSGAVFARWMAAAEAFAEGEKAGWPTLYRRESWDGWSAGRRLRPRPLASVITKGDAGARLVADARIFLGREAWYAERGVPWRRGYLLYGPPGSGKTSLIRAAATELGLDLAIIDLARKSLDDSGLADALSSAPKGAALVLEDIDAAFRQRDREDAASGLSFSGLLNALDGLAAQEGRIVMMTTNHRELLDPALIRPGRADLHLEIGLAGPAEAAALFLRFFPGAEAQAEALATQLEGEAAPAAVQAALLAAPENAGAAALALRRLYAETASEDAAGQAAASAAVAAE